jgi:hypothetical protein
MPAIQHWNVGHSNSLYTVTTIKFMRITFDPGKRTQTLQTRGLDFLDAAQVLAGEHVTGFDDRQNYGEER